MIVVDTNVIAYFTIKHQQTDEAERLFARDGEWHAPFLWRSEFRNVLALHVRLRDLALPQAKHHWLLAERQMRDREHQVEASEVLECAVESSASAYDCEFVVLARSLGVPFVTSDRKLVRFFPDAAHLLADFVR